MLKTLLWEPMMAGISSRNLVKGAVAVAALSSASLVFDNWLLSGAIRCFLGDEAYKLLLQFLMITLTGGLFFAYLGIRKDEQARSDIRIGRLQALDEKLSEAHRQMKSSKRRLRSKLDRTTDPKFMIAKDDFEDCMSEVLAAQLLVEEVQDLVSTRRDLIDKNDLQLVDRALQYAARYLHDVYEDFEQGRVPREDGVFSITEKTPRNVGDFLFKPDEPETIAGQLAILKDRNRPQADLLMSLDAVDDCRDASGKIKLRFGKVAIECMRLASWALKRLMDAEMPGSRQRGQF